MNRRDSRSGAPLATRREFLSGLVVTTSGAAALAAGVGGIAVAGQPPNATAAADEEPRGYRESQHVRDYYRAARF